MMKRACSTWWATMLVVVGVLGAENAAAQLSEVDLVPGSGDARATFDAGTGLYWLDVDETTNRSVAEILGGAGGWIGSGWRYATPTEICDLFASYALAVLSCGGASPATASGDLLAFLQGFVGVTLDNGINRSTRGFYDDGGDPTRVGLGRLTYTISTDTSTSLVQTSAAPDTALSNVGHWLVRNTPPPLPVPAFSFRLSPLSGTAAALVLAACAALSGARRRSRAAVWRRNC